MKRGLYANLSVHESRARARSKPIHDIHPLSGIDIEVFYADRTLETFGRADFW
jgi:hypothetical protein